VNVAPILDVARAWNRLGLRVLPQDGLWPIVTAVMLGLAFGAYMAVADAFLFRAVVPASQTMMVDEANAVQRIALFVPLAVLDEIEFRLLLMSAVVWLLTISTEGRDPVSPRRNLRFWVAIIAVAIIYLPLHPTYLASLGPLTPMLASREVALHVAAGILWGYLYWRSGLVASIAGHVSAHLTLQPLLGHFSHSL
jgi:hypothetical protein